MNLKQFKPDILLIILIFSLVLDGCDSVNQRAITAEKFLMSSVDSASNHLLGVTNFRKIEGIEKQDDGISYYIVAFKGFIGATRDCYWDGYVYKRNLIFPNRTRVNSMNVTESSKNIRISDNVGDYTFFKKGLGRYVKGAIVLAKLESGWTVVDAEVNFDSAPDNQTVIKNEKPLQSNVEKLDKFKREVDAVDEKSQYRSVYLKFYGEDTPIKVNNLQWPENLEEVETTFNVIHNEQNRIIAFVQMPFSQSGDWSKTVTYYFDDSGKTICIKKEMSEYYANSNIQAYKEGKLYFYTNERVFDNGFNTISVTNEITDAKDKKINDPNFNFTTFMNEFPDFRNAESILQSFRIS